MKNLKIIKLVPCLLFFFSSAIIGQERSEVHSVILNESKLRINGTSNVNDFVCSYQREFESDTLSHRVELFNQHLSVQGDTLKLDIDSFDCGRRGINRDFRKTLKTENSKNISISLQKLSFSECKPQTIGVDISIAGVTKPYEIFLNEFSVKENVISVKGRKNFLMSDFGIDPPTALLGLIKVRDYLEIDFELEFIQPQKKVGILIPTCS